MDARFSRAWYNLCTVVAVVLLVLAFVVRQGGDVKISLVTLLILAAIFFVARDIRWA